MIGKVSGECGQYNENGVDISLQDPPKGVTQFGEFPWMIAVLNKGQMICGGVLISKSAILTVAHCVYGISNKDLQVRAGEWDTNTDHEPWPHVDKNVAKIIIHENYHDEDENYFFDIAMLQLAEPFELKPHINTICLSNSESDFINANCFVTGWGKDKFGKEGRRQVFLKKIKLSVVPRSTCELQLRNTMLGNYFELHESFICAGGEAGVDACEGDGGSALVCEIPGKKGRYQAAGLVAWGLECGLPDVPGAYTNLPLLRGWIDKQLTEIN